MKAVQQITLKDDKGTPIRDISDDVISMEHMRLLQSKQPVPDEAYPALTMDYMLKRMIDLSTYKTRSEQRRADDIYQKIKVTDDRIVLEDGELDFLDKLREKFQPYLSGRMFNAFHEAMENATTISQ